MQAAKQKPIRQQVELTYQGDTIARIFFHRDKEKYFWRGYETHFLIEAKPLHQSQNFDESSLCLRHAIRWFEKKGFDTSLIEVGVESIKERQVFPEISLQDFQLPLRIVIAETLFIDIEKDHTVSVKSTITSAIPKAS